MNELQVPRSRPHGARVAGWGPVGDSARFEQLRRVGWRERRHRRTNASRWANWRASQRNA